MWLHGRLESQAVCELQVSLKLTWRVVAQHCARMQPPIEMRCPAAARTPTRSSPLQPPVPIFVKREQVGDNHVSQLACGGELDAGPLAFMKTLEPRETEILWHHARKE